MRSRPFQIYVAIQALAIGAFAFVQPEGWRHTFWQVAVGYAASLAMVLAATRRQAPGATTWYWFALGVFLNTTGILVAELQASPEFVSPSIADAFWIALIPCLAIGMAGLIRARDRTAGWTDLVDSSTLTSGFGILSWVFLIRPQVLETHLTLIGRTVILAYPVGDIVVMAMVVRLMHGPGLRGPSFRLLVSAVLCFLAADVGWAVSANWAGADESFLPQLFATMSLLAFGALGAAAVHPSMADMALPKETRVRARLHPVLVAALTVASLMTPSLLLGEALQGMVSNGLALALSSSVLFLLVVVRMTVLFRRVELQAEQLRELNRVDELTQLPNRRAVAYELPNALARALRASHSLSVAIIDLDSFHVFNDTHGHRAGDQLLRDAASLWRERLRAVDLLGRFVADQFVAILPDANAHETVTALQRLRPVTPYGQTFSAGVATWNQGESPDDFVARAANALHFAKQSGRDQIVVAAEQSPTVSVVHHA